MECPYCQKKMEKGTLRCFRGYSIIWKSDQNPEQKIKLYNAWNFKFQHPKVENFYYCQSCKFIMKKLKE